MEITIQLTPEQLDKLNYIEQKTDFDPNQLISQEIEQKYQQLQVQASDKVANLFWSKEAARYINKQSQIFDLMLSDLAERYAGMYVVFEDGTVIDADIDEDVLLDRVWEQDFAQDRMAKYQSIFCHLVSRANFCF